MNCKRINYIYDNGIEKTYTNISYPRQIQLFKDRNNYHGLNHFQGVLRFMVWRFLFVCVRDKWCLCLASLIPPYQGFSCENMRCQFTSGLSCGPRRPKIAYIVEIDFRLPADYPMAPGSSEVQAGRCCKGPGEVPTASPGQGPVFC